MFIRTRTAALLLGLTVAGVAGAQKQAGAAKLTLTSPDIREGQKIASAQVLNGMGCTGSNTSPALRWSGAPAGTKSFAITAYDPDAPTGSGWWHWVVYNIPASATQLAAGAGDPKKTLLPAGATQGNTDFGAPGYGGPCPPAGDKPHHYHFTLRARRRQAGCSGWRDRGVRWLQPPRAHAREDDAHGALRSMIEGPLSGAVARDTL
jgi:Raf kinase inhibitor-like YbhB/YbcL family protein